MKTAKEWTRTCPGCGKTIKYISRVTKKKGERLDSKCKSCLAKRTIATHEHTREAILRAASTRTGIAHTGKNAADENNMRGISGDLRDPRGKSHKFKNLSHFVRENEHLFPPESTIWKSVGRSLNGKKAKTRSCNALVGLLRIMPTQKHPMCSWRGWTVGSMVESVCTNGTDLLDRKAA